MLYLFIIIFTTTYFKSSETSIKSMLSVNFSKIQFKLINPFPDPRGTTGRTNPVNRVCPFYLKRE